MDRRQIFIIRAVMGAVFGVILSRFFYPDAPIVFIIVLCAALVGLAYVTEYLRRRSKHKAGMKDAPKGDVSH